MNGSDEDAPRAEHTRQKVLDRTSRSGAEAGAAAFSAANKPPARSRSLQIVAKLEASSKQKSWRERFAAPPPEPENPTPVEALRAAGTTGAQGERPSRPGNELGLKVHLRRVATVVEHRYCVFCRAGH
jgi:hypothetical protein